MTSTEIFDNPLTTYIPFVINYTASTQISGIIDEIQNYLNFIGVMENNIKINRMLWLPRKEKKVKLQNVSMKKRFIKIFKGNKFKVGGSKK